VSSGAGGSSAESSTEVLERLLEPNLGGIQRAHRRRQPVFGEVVRLYVACLRDELHGAHRWLVVPVGEHVDVRVGHAPAVELARGLGETAIAQATLGHQRAERVSEWFVAETLHARPPRQLRAVRSVIGALEPIALGSSKTPSGRFGT
jgi:hypothetical protein